MPHRTLTPMTLAAALLAAQSMASRVGAEEARPTRGFGPQGPRVVSPEVSPDRTIAFRILAPRAEAVQLSGSDIPEIGRGKAMTKGEDGVWEATVGPVEAGAYRYRFDVDGVPTMDPRNPSTSESQGNAWSLVVVPGSDVSDTKDVPHGAVAEVTYWSRSLQRFRRMHVYTPPGYEKGSETYPVLYLLHGASDSDDSWTSVGRAGCILDNLIAAGKAVPMVVVMPAGHTGAVGTFGGRGAGGRDEFLADFLEDIVPCAERSYRIRADAAHRAVAGLSMGGGQTLSIAMAGLDDFAHYGVFSSGVFGIAGGGRGGAATGPSWEEQNQKTLDDPELKKGLRLVWFATGTEDFLIETSRRTVEVLRQHGFDVTYRESGGGHTWLNWRQYLHDFAPLLFRDAASAGAGTSAGAGSSSAAGTWSAELDTQIGVQKYVFTLRTEGDKVTGKAASEILGTKREVELTDGRIEGDEVSFAETLDFDGMALRIAYRGKVSGDEIAFTRQVGEVATETFVAKRVAGGEAGTRPKETAPKETSMAEEPKEATAAKDEPKAETAPAGFDARREGIPRGAVETVEYDSKSIGIRRKMVVYTPPGYSKDRRYPVLYLLHGIGDEEGHWIERGSADAILDNLIADGMALPMVVVMPNGRAAAGVTVQTPWNEQFAAFEAFEKDLLEDVIPLVESRYSVESGPKHRAIAGLSMGGGQSLNFGLKHLETFAWIGGFSSAPNTKPAAELLPDPERAAKEISLLWLSCGDRDGLMRLSQEFRAYLEETKVPHVWHVGSGGHAWPVWKSDLYLFARRLFR